VRDSGLINHSQAFPSGGAPFLTALVMPWALATYVGQSIVTVSSFFPSFFLSWPGGDRLGRCLVVSPFLVFLTLSSPSTLRTILFVSLFPFLPMFPRFNSDHPVPAFPVTAPSETPFDAWNPPSVFGPA